MPQNSNRKDDKKSKENKVKTIAGFLATALDIEDEMSSAVYGEYLDRKAWPASLSPDVFQMIKEFLTILIQETEGHKRAFLHLQNKLSSNNNVTEQ